MNNSKENSVEGRICPDKYSRICAHLDKEDDLINNRINWLMASQALLFAALQFRNDVIIMKTVAWVGVLSSSVIWFSVLAAILTFCHYLQLLKKACPPDCDPEECFPQLHRRSLFLSLGFLSPIFIPIIFVGAWSYLLCTFYCK